MCLIIKLQIRTVEQKAFKMATAPAVPSLFSIPKEMLCIVPIFNGSKRHLNLFIRKSEYVLNKYRGNAEQEQYALHTISSRMTEDAAALLSERNDIQTWEQLKTLLTQHFGDPRSEECIAIELETLKMKQGESYLEFCNRIQSVRSILISKVNQLSDIGIRTSKISIYNNMALNVFLYNLSENLIRAVRMKMPGTLEKALEYVLEEVNFYEQYNLRSKMLKPQVQAQPAAGTATSSSAKIMNSPPFQSYRPAYNALPSFKFGIPGNSQYRQPFVNKFTPQTQQAPTGYRPPWIQPQQFGMSRFTQPQGFIPRPQQFGYRPQQFGYRPQNQFGYKPPNPLGSGDVTMRTAPPLKQQTQAPTQQPQGFRLNELDLGENYGYETYENQEGFGYDQDLYEDYYDPQTEPAMENEQENLVTDETVNATEIGNFHILASKADER